MSEIIKEVLSEIVPQTERRQKIIETADKILKKANKIAPDGVEAMLVGSVAKNTFLADVDIDVFLRFPIDTNLKERGLEIARKIIPKGEEMYASHPYLRGEIEGIFVDVVPCYKIKDVNELKSAVDRTPFHTEYIKKEIKGMEDEVRLAKQFMKGIGAYGASSSVGGFSGYLVEILVIQNKGFEGFIEWLSNCECPLTIDDIEGNNHGDIMVMKDPVDSKRNVAASVTIDVLSMTILAAKTFLEKESSNYFFSNRESKKECGNITTINFSVPKMDKESALSWLRSEARKIIRNLEEFKIISYNVEINDKATILIESEISERPAKIKHVGPSPWKEGAVDFLEKYPNASIFEGKLVVARNPRFGTIKNAIQNLIPEAEVKSVKIMPKKLPWL